MALRIIIHNVGHGQAIHVFTPAGEIVVIDLGCSAFFSPLEWLRNQTQIIDSLIITHPHGDHIDEMLDIKKHGFKVRQLWRPKWLPKEEIYKQNQSGYTEKLDSYFEMSDSYKYPVKKNELVGNPEISGGVKIDKFSSKECGVSNINNHSAVVCFDYQNVKIVIPGDNEPPSWKALMGKDEFRNYMGNIDVFMASHHGRISGYYSDVFISKPNLCIVSDGRVQDTDSRDRYSYHANGWSVTKRSDSTKVQRYCLTTRNDNYVDIKVGKNPNGRPYLAVEID